MTWTVLSLLRSATGHLERLGIPEAGLDAGVLLGHVLGKSRLDLYVGHDMPVEDAHRDAYRECIRRRAAREPVAYIIGEREFHGRSFKVDRRVLVPRPETELIVDLARASAAFPARRGLDVGTGSGCLAITLALELGLAMTATDLSEDALSVARENARILLPGREVRWLEGAWFSAIPTGEAFGLIVSNPPYIPDAEVEGLMPEVRDFEPRLALACGSDRWQPYRTLLGGLGDRLLVGGLALFEMPGEEGAPIPEFRSLLGKGFSIDVVADIGGRPRVLRVARSPSSTALPL